MEQGRRDLGIAIIPKKKIKEPRYLEQREVIQGHLGWKNLSECTPPDTNNREASSSRFLGTCMIFTLCAVKKSIIFITTSSLFWLKTCCEYEIYDRIPSSGFCQGQKPHLIQLKQRRNTQEVLPIPASSLPRSDE